MIADRAFGKRLYLVAVIGALLYCVAAWNMALAVFTVVAATIAAVATGLGGGRSLPRLVINIMIALTVLWTLRGFSDGRLDVDDFSRFLVMIVLIKLFDLRTPRDEAQVLALTVFLALGAILTSNSLELGLLLALLCPLLVGVVMQHQLRAAEWRVVGRPRDYRAETSASSPASRRDLRRLTWMVVCSSMGISAAVFLLFPRGLGDSAFGAWGNPAVRQQQTGFADQVELGVGGLISESHTPVLDVQFRSGDGTVLGGDDQIFYLRGAVLDSYAHGWWRRADKSRSTAWKRYEGEARLGTRLSPDRSARITLRSVGGNSHLFTEYMPVRLESEQRQQLSWDPGNFQIWRRGQPGRYVYEVFSATRRPRGQQRDRGEIVEPLGVSGVREFAVEAIGPNLEADPYSRAPSDDDVAARKIEQWLQRSCVYSLETRAAPMDVDPIVWFLSDMREGHCEYFASAMAAMCRSIGVNARVITGYVAAEWNPLTEHYVVRESNAHAWVEVEVGDDIWWPYDPTPPADLQTIHRPEPGPLAKVSRFFNAIEHGWNSFVIGYDASIRAELLGTDPDRPWGSQEAATATWRTFQTGGRSLIVRAVLNGAMVFLACALLGLVIRIAVARRRAARAPEDVDDPDLRARLHQVRAYAHALESLELLGMAKPGSATPLEYARHVAGRDQHAGGLFAEIVGVYYRVRFGGRNLSDAQRRTLDASAKALRSLVR